MKPTHYCRLSTGPTPHDVSGSAPEGGPTAPYARAVMDAAEGAERASWSRDDDLVAQLTRWLAEQRVDAATTARSHERWLRQQSEEEGTFAGVLVDLAERGRPVVIHASGDRRHRGVVRAVADDFVALRTGPGTDVLLAYRGITLVRPGSGEPAVTGERSRPLDTTLAEALAALAGQRARLLVVTLDGAGVAGELRAVGRDVLMMRLDGAGRREVYVSVAAVAEVSLAF